MIIKSLDIGRKTTKNNVFVAPLAGFSDAEFRRVCYDLGAGLCFTEMVSAKGILYDNKNTVDLLETTDSEYIKAVQIFGNDPEIFKTVCSYGHLDKFDVVDINMGCPVPKVFGNGEGSALLLDPPLCGALVSACVSAGKTVTVKMRLGVEKGTFYALEVAKRVEEAGAKLITVHARRRDDYYSGEPDVGAVSKIVSSVSVPVIFNGSVDGVSSADRYLMETGAAGVMLARAALTAPWVVADILGNRDYDKKKIILSHIDGEFDRYGDYAAIKLRKQMSFYLKNVRGAKSLRIRAFGATNRAELRSIVEDMEF